MFLKLDRLLQSVGMETFIEYFVQFAHKNIYSTIDLYNILSEEKNFEENSIKVKIYAGRKIFEEDLEEAALLKIIQSKRVSEEIKLGAKSFLDEIYSEGR